MSSKAKGVVALILVVAVLANVGIFAKMSYNKTHTAQETIVFRVGDTVASDHPISQALYMFEEELERISNGRFDVRVYINSALGGDRQQTESVILGYMQGNTPPRPCWRASIPASWWWTCPSYSRAAKRP